MTTPKRRYVNDIYVYDNGDMILPEMLIKMEKKIDIVIIEEYKKDMVIRFKILKGYTIRVIYSIYEKDPMDYHNYKGITL